MTEHYRPRVRYVMGPDGSPLTIADLPPQNTKRWVIRRKAEVVAGVRAGLIKPSPRAIRPLGRAKRHPVQLDEIGSLFRALPNQSQGLALHLVTKFRDQFDAVIYRRHRSDDIVAQARAEEFHDP